MLARHELICLSALFLAACGTRPDPLYCDEQTPCTDPDRPFCDLSGSFAASNGIARTCIPDPSSLPDGGVDGDGGGSDGGGGSCTRSDQCSEATPICSGGHCVTCEPAEFSADCAERDPDTTVCTSGGRCVECERNSHCDASEPICESPGNFCRPCQAHDECDSGVCRIGVGTCVATAEVIYVDFDQGGDGPGCGAAPLGEACRTLSFPLGGLAKVTAQRKWVRMAPVVHREFAYIDGLDVYLVGPDALLMPADFNRGTPLAIGDGAHVVIDGLTLGNGNGTSEGVGLRCVDSEVELVRATLRDNDSSGLAGDTCQLSLEGCVVSDNGRRGIDLDDCELTVNTTWIADNGRPGISADASEVIVRRSIISGNSIGGIELGNSEFTIENTFVVQNGTFGVGGAAPFGGVRVDSGPGPGTQLLRHTTIAHNRASPISSATGLICNTANPVSASGLIVWRNQIPTGDAVQISGNADVEYSLVDGGEPGTGNFDADPEFVNALQLDYHLQAGSPAIDVASPAGLVDEDFDGDARPLGGGYDVGADEVIP